MKNAMAAGLCLSLVFSLMAFQPNESENFKVYMPFLIREGNQAVWLVKMKGPADKPALEVMATANQMPKANVENLAAKDGQISFDLKTKQGTFQFQGNMPKEKGGKILGSVQFRDIISPAFMEPTTVTSLDDYEINKEILTKPSQNSHEVVKAALSLLAEAEIRKSKVEEVRGWADKAVISAQAHGDRWRGQVVLEVAELLATQKDYAPIALQYARQAQRALPEKATPAQQAQVLEILADALVASGKNDEAKEIQTKLEKIDTGLKPEPFAGRKGKSDQAVVVELFTGTECPPCVAADLAFDALGKAFKPAEVILLQYHLHIPGPDPLTNPDSENRARVYGKQIEGTPAVFFNGKSAAGGGGPRDAAMDKFQEYRKVVEPLLEKVPGAKLSASAALKGEDVTIMAEVSELATTGNNIRLNMVLSEKEVRYTGGNKQKKHHLVVRSFPAGVEGFPLPEKTAKKEAKVNLGELRKKWSSYLDQVAREEPFSGKGRPLEFRDLFAVVFVQNVTTGEILQAVEVPVK